MQSTLQERDGWRSVNDTLREGVQIMAGDTHETGVRLFLGSALLFHEATRQRATVDVEGSA
jgi:hypothetical protein